MNRFIYFVIFALLLPLTLPSFAAEQKLYQVELIVFSQINKKGIDSEQWPPTPAFELPSNEIVTLIPKTGFDTATIGDNQIQLLPASHFRLSPASSAIDSNPNYKTLLHIAWVADMSQPKYSMPIHIQGGNYFTDGGEAINNPTDDDRKTLTPQVDGLLSIKLQRYFDVTVNLTFSAPLKQIASLGQTDYFNSLSSGLLHFQMLQSRRMRSQELNYFDYPLYGIVMQIFPLQTNPEP